jgi:hypothetical protein
MNDHTPEPWIIKQYPDGAWGIRQAPSTPSCRIGNGPLLACGFAIASLVDNGEETEANANRILSCVNATP